MAVRGPSRAGRPAETVAPLSNRETLPRHRRRCLNVSECFGALENGKAGAREKGRAGARGNERAGVRRGREGWRAGGRDGLHTRGRDGLRTKGRDGGEDGRAGAREDGTAARAGGRGAAGAREDGTDERTGRTRERDGREDGRAGTREDGTAARGKLGRPAHEKTERSRGRDGQRMRRRRTLHGGARIENTVNNLCVPGDAQEPPAPRMAPFPQHEDLSHPVRRCWTSSGSEGSSEEKGVGEEAATRSRGERWLRCRNRPFVWQNPSRGKLGEFGWIDRFNEQMDRLNY